MENTERETTRLEKPGCYRRRAGAVPRDRESPAANRFRMHFY
jgi:hypothetical protein